MNPGKIFENDFKNSIPDDCWLYRLRDNAASFDRSKSTRFASNNACDFILYTDYSPMLFLLELKTVQNKSIPFSMVRKNQIDSLREYSKHNLFAGLICNYRNEDNDTFFIDINDFIYMQSTINKKSFNVDDLIRYNALRIESKKKRIHYLYDVKKFTKTLVERKNEND